MNLTMFRISSEPSCHTRTQTRWLCVYAYVWWKPDEMSILVCFECMKQCYYDYSRSSKSATNCEVLPLSMFEIWMYLHIWFICLVYTNRFSTHICVGYIHLNEWIPYLSLNAESSSFSRQYRKQHIRHIWTICMQSEFVDG